MSMKKARIFVYIFYVSYCTRVVANSLTVVRVTDFALIFMFIFIICVYLISRHRKLKMCAEISRFACICKSIEPVASKMLLFTFGRVWFLLCDIRMSFTHHY
jgi:hypothetical protein